MPSWKDLIPGCFGSVDKFFANHSADKQRARDMLRDALIAGATMADIETEARKALNGCEEAHIEEQLRRMRELDHYFD